MILGLDCSTTVCGWAVYNGTRIINAGFLDISKFDTNKEKSQFIIRTIEALEEAKFLKEIRLEASLSGFQRGRTSQQVVIKLTRFNAVLEYVLGEHFKLPVILIGANTARKQVLGKAFIKGMTPKEYVKEHLPLQHPEIKSFEKLNNKGNWNVKNGDMYDAAVVSMTS